MDVLFALALLASFFGPVFHRLIESHTRTSRFIDGMVITSMVGLVIMHILPESLEHLGPATYFAVLLGLLGPLVWSTMVNRHECEVPKLLLVITVCGFLAHNLLDGAALIVPNLGSSHLLALAVIVHRAIASLALWRTFAKTLGTWLTLGVLAGLSVAMATGYFAGEYLLSHMELDILHVLQSLACGMLLHVLLHPHHLREIFSDIKSAHINFRFQSMGAFCGILLAVLAYLFWPAHSHDDQTHVREAVSVTHERQ